MRTHHLAGNVISRDLNAVYNDEKYTCSSLKLMQQSEQAFKEVKEISLGKHTKQSKVSIEFSPDGQYLALLLRKTYELKIYKIEEKDIEGLLE